MVCNCVCFCSIAIGQLIILVLPVFAYWKSYFLGQGCHILEKSWKVLDFFCCPGKSLKVLEFCLLVLESPGKIFIKFSRNLPGHKVKLFFFFMITGTLQLYKAIVEKISVVKFVQKALLYC